MGHIQLSWKYIILCTVHFITILKAALAGDVQGTFELELSSFINNQAVDTDGQCCGGSDSSVCTSPCETFFRICLLHFMRDIPTDQAQCTYGSIITPVLGENTFLIPNAVPEENFNNPLRIDFKFDWPGSFSLIIEAYHDVQHTGPYEGSERTLLSRVAVQRVRNVTEEWTQESHTDDHHTMDFKFRVLCEANYYGPKCATRCVPKDSYLGHWSCDAEGQRMCLPGWSGSYCDQAVCDRGCVHGSCDNPGQCRCDPGWEGDMCDKCIRYPGCEQGTCRAPGQCNCRPGWGGMLCDQDLNYCTNHHPCKNGATCKNEGPTGYQCFCPPGYTGEDCGVMEACVCENGGTCMSTGSGFECLCADDYTGEFCEFYDPPVYTTAAPRCTEAKCENGGSCYDTEDGSFYCVCPYGFRGAFCETLDHCSSMPCENGGTCYNQVDSFVCVCPTGFTGDRCHISLCNSNTCKNGGTCVSDFESLSCECPEGFRGSHCEIIMEHDQCTDNPCAFGGSCELDDALPHGYRCYCPEGFTGRNCTTIDSGCSRTRPCENGGSCIKDLESGRDVCLCLPGWEGLFCDMRFPTTDSLDTTKLSPAVGHTLNENKGGFTDVMQIGIYVAFGVLILVLFVILIIVACRRHYHHSHNHDRNSHVDVEKQDSTPNNISLYKNDFSQEDLRKTHQPLLSISEKVCNKQIEIDSDNIKKSTCKDYTPKDYQHDSLPVEKLQENQCIQYVPQSRHSYPKNTDSGDYFYYDEKPSKLKRTDSLQQQANQHCNTPDSSPRHSIKLISAVIEDKPVNRNSQCYSVSQLNEDRPTTTQQQRLTTELTEV